MLAKIQSFGLFGMVGYPVQVEVDVTGGLQRLNWWVCRMRR